MEKEYYFVIITGILSGGVVFGGKILSDIGLSLYEISMLSSLFTVILLFPFMLKKEYRLTKDKISILLAYGLIAAILDLSQYGSVILGIPVALAVLLLYTQPLWTAIFSRLFLNEKITRMKILSVGIVLFGLLFLINPFTITDIGSLPGIIVGLIGGISLSGWVIFGRIAGKKKICPITTKFGYVLFAMIFVTISYPITNLLVKQPSITSFSFSHPIKIWAYILIFVLITGIISHLFYFKGVEKVTASDAGIILLLEPVSASILASIFLRQAITINIIIGGLLILFSNYLAIKEEG